VDYRELAKGINVHEIGSPADSFPPKPYRLKVGSYEVARKTKKAEDIKRFLKDWNPRVPFNFQKLKVAMEEAKPAVRIICMFSFHHVDLVGTINETELTWHKLITSLFKKFSLVVKYTNTSKVLHVLVPQIFVMWDQDIREAYGCYKNEEGYYNFHIRMQMELEEVIKSYQKDYESSREEAVKQICQRFYEAGGHPITRLLDIYNHEKYRRRKF